MALVKCKDCGKEISDTIDTCIHCGCPQNNKKVQTVTLSQFNSNQKVSNLFIRIIGFVPFLAMVLLWIVWYLTNSYYVGMVCMIIIFLLVQLPLVKCDYNLLNKNHIDTSIFGKFNIFRISIPKYIYQRYQLLKKGIDSFIIWIIGFALFVAVIVLEINPLYLINLNINRVKSGNFYYCSSYTVEEVINSYIDNPKWRNIVLKDKSIGVEVSGSAKSDKNKKIVIQYTITKEEFNFGSLKINGVEKPEYIYNDLIESMCRKKYNKSKSNIKNNQTSNKDTNNDDNEDYNNTNYDDYDSSLTYDELLNNNEFIQEVTFNQFKTIISGYTFSIVYIGSPSCIHCYNFLKTLEKVLPKYKLKIWYLDVDKISDEERDEMIDYIEYFEEGIATPSTLAISNDQVISILEGEVKEDELVSFLKKYKYID